MLPSVMNEIYCEGSVIRKEVLAFFNASTLIPSK